MGQADRIDDARHYCAWLGRFINPDPAGIGGQVNLLDVQLPTNAGRPIVDLQVPAQVMAQILAAPYPSGTDSSGHGIPSATFGAQATVGLGVDFHLTNHLSLLGNVGGGAAYVGGSGFGPAFRPRSASAIIRASRLRRR